MSLYMKRRMKEGLLVLIPVAIVIVLKFIFGVDALPYIFIGVLFIGVLALWIAPRKDEGHDGQ